LQREVDRVSLAVGVSGRGHGFLLLSGAQQGISTLFRIADG
jgi:hypothetical protein